ncbi:hypothetical protein IWQ57_004546 [Coemansia nantahalensis]|uniref:Uncharacterized protein n=1 Tax=Coemansia nantahalensis TaxID=2789366 RepID=A0ACC1JRH8_9FUNG|nr:hypothetical protein IWQ57_004546 [Coemansia nantahalensis]
MLSETVRSTAASGKAEDVAAAGPVDWLPDFGPPDITLDLLTLTPDTPAPEPAATPALSSLKAGAEPAATPAAAAIGLPDAGLYANFGDYAGMVSDMSGYLLDRVDDSAAADANAPAANTPSDDDDPGMAFVPHTPSAQQQLLATAGVGEPLSGDHEQQPATPRLSFHFHTDPTIDAISSVPLFPLATPAAGAVAPAAQPADGAAGASSPAAAQPQMQLLADSPKSESSENAASRKSRGRRSSFAGLLMRRAGRNVEAKAAPDSHEAAELPADQDEPAAAPVPLSPVAASGKLSTASGESSVVVHESTDQAASTVARSWANAPSPVPDTDAAAVPSCASLVPSAAQPAAAPASAETQEDAPASEADRDTSCSCSISSSVAEDAEDNGPASDGPGDAAGDAICGAGATSSESAPAACELPPAPPANTRGLEKRSSRIISGITRKVNYVRQTTSMVLRRSVGSRLSMAVDRFAEPSAERSQCSTGAATDEVDAGKDAQKPSLEDSAGELEPVGSKDERPADASDPAPAADAPDAAEDVPAETASASADLATTASAPEPGTAAEPDSPSAGSADKGGSDAAATSLSRRLGLVRHGTNVAVRSGVSRVKSMFVAKRSVAA